MNEVFDATKNIGDITSTHIIYRYYAPMEHLPIPYYAPTEHREWNNKTSHNNSILYCFYGSFLGGFMPIVLWQ
jgi:hypothetical protein